ncbi:type II toxin-antitoxin system YoeB family toxin [Mucilaginibacter gotjawali]|uniref:Putative mRNA interferase YoeB n=1 Tax=Mucilaginibacter gotjawali TaxID=1550579 RepID=A0A839SED6_9SPHI|nr:type II toxin-antitoxin system YoeB family toxin [Mucilaginibacter gotjawali]MBB3056601.1 Txe/YoeB family toxin of Txe-Axe toxin-antitoxin module [Mucilaginibacter gotjawali]
MAENESIAEERFYQLIKTFKKAKERYGFNHIRFPLNHHDQQVTLKRNFYEVVSNFSNQTYKNLIVDLCKSPFIDDLEDDELNMFYSSKYEIIDEDVPTKASPLGLPVAFIKSSPAVSLNSHPFWRKKKISILKSSENEIENAILIVYNICLETDVDAKELSEWADNFLPSELTTEEEIKKYLNYTKYSIVFSPEFLVQFFEWKTNDTDKYKYLLQLLKDVEVHPFTGGMGQTENLKYRGKEASKRVTQADRLSYTLDNNLVTFLACKGHYKFH